MYTGCCRRTSAKGGLYFGLCKAKNKYKMALDASSCLCRHHVWNHGTDCQQYKCFHCAICRRIRLYNSPVSIVFLYTKYYNGNLYSYRSDHRFKNELPGLYQYCCCTCRSRACTFVSSDICTGMLSFFCTLWHFLFFYLLPADFHRYC